MECAFEAARVRLLHQRINVAVIVVHALARVAKDVGNVGGRGLVVGAQALPELTLEGADLWLPDAFQAPRLAEIEDKSLFAVGLCHLCSNSW